MSIATITQRQREAREGKSSFTHRDCLDYGDGQCSGEVEYRMPLSGTGRSFTRCDYHWDKRLDEQERITRVYPDSPVAPDWFDEAYAGERWNEDY
jgi:hypothetical protein